MTQRWRLNPKGVWLELPSPQSRTRNQEEDDNKQTPDKESDGDDNSNKDKYVFLYFTEAKNHDGDDKEGNDPIGNRLYRYEFNNTSQLGNAKLLLDLPGMPGPAHDGGSIVIGPDNNLVSDIRQCKRA